jgi:tRNA threonylcarbamoyl adenosine modification protein YeaZ
MITLVLEASTYEGSAALLDGSGLLGERLVAMRGREHEALMAAVGELIELSGLSPNALDRVVCGAGPGSFTSLRIAASIAKGLCLATGAELVPVSSLSLLAASYAPSGRERALATLDAMRGEQYVQLYEVGGSDEPVELNPAALLPTEALAETAQTLGAVIIGPGATGRLHVVPRAASARRITNMIERTAPADLAGWEPGYGRLAEAQVKWEATHGRPLTA